ncbi:cell division protein ZapE [Nocardia cyriacigeorgica]|uniref:cell division protein ZapE n=1 Tax=Nocardia cyriacigeorgica TaxID=135487 RepID=UPI00245886D6|nr:cell division protein ZapE [Nocardia cyriacigeorgica]
METIRLDADQQHAAAVLDGLLDRRHRPRKHHRGVYLHGRPGRGKTMVMDRFLATVDSNRKRRFHFHTFFAALHTDAHTTGSIDTAIDALLGNARLVCFDEFHVHDIGDAMLITRTLDALFARRRTLVVTSNYAPAELLPNPLFHDHFLPTIDRITAELDVVSLDGPLDYRTTSSGSATGFRSGRYVVGPASDSVAAVTGPGGVQPTDSAFTGTEPLARDRHTPGAEIDGVMDASGGRAGEADPGRIAVTPDPSALAGAVPYGAPTTRPTAVDVRWSPADRAASRIASSSLIGRVESDEATHRTCAPGGASGEVSDSSTDGPGPRVEVPIGSRTVRARAATADTITIDFADLCATPTSAADYVRLAERFHTWTLCGVPLLREVPPDWAMRLVNLVDVLYDADLPLTVYAAAPVDDLIGGVHGVPDIARAASRLGELSQTGAVAVG